MHLNKYVVVKIKKKMSDMHEDLDFSFFLWRGPSKGQHHTNY